MNIFLTSAGFDNKEILHLFVQTAHSNRPGARLLFVPTAAITAGGKEMLPFCRQEIWEAGIAEDHTDEIEISGIPSIKDLDQYCAIYVAGGDTQYLVDQMNQHHFRGILDRYLASGGVYLGVSAGSIALTNSFPGCLNYINCHLGVHGELGRAPGRIDRETFCEIQLTDNQAIVMRGPSTEIIG